MGRSPCCDKANVKKGPWSPEEDTKLKTYIEQHGTGGNWIALPQKIDFAQNCLKRCGKSCRLRWLNYLRPNIKHGEFSEEEDQIICSLYVSIGSRWSIIAAQLPGRTDNDIKNYWNTRLKKKLLGKQRKEHARRGGNSSKLRTKKSNGENSMVSNININQTFPSWSGSIPVLAPIPYSNHEPRFDDHSSIRKLLIKLGGKFSDDENNIQGEPSSHLPVISSCAAPNPIYATLLCSSMDTRNVYTSLVSGSPLLPSVSNISGAFEGMRYDHNIPHRLDGLEFLYDTTTGTSINWGDTSNLSYPLIVPNYDDTLPRQCGLDELRYGAVQ